MTTYNVAHCCECTRAQCNHIYLLFEHAWGFYKLFTSKMNIYYEYEPIFFQKAIIEEEDLEMNQRVNLLHLWL